MLSRYCGLGRAAELVLVQPDDQLFATVLPLPRVRYYTLGDAPVSGRYGMDFASMGVVLDSARFDDLDRSLPAFRSRLREWGEPSAAPIGAIIVGSTAADLERTIRSHPATDFFLPERWGEAAAEAATPTHEVVRVPPGHFLFLARQTHAAALPRWSCNP
jgi:hypothetical protein